MTPEKQRIAIAKACGWRGISEQFLVGYNPSRPVPYEQRILGNIEEIPLDPLPDYLNDLNAMREAVMTLNSSLNDSNGLAATFCELLEIGHEDDCDCWIEYLVPSAKQLAKAFLCALELWENKP
jgi:hypothetical protein